jgi:predicted DCC family thiol-disulfide oxidoreductase YuxK
MMTQLLKIDKQRHFLLCAQQTDMGHLVLERHGINVADLSTIYLITNCATEDEKVLTRSDAFIYVLSKTEAYKGLASLLGIFPRPLLNFGYNIIARNRYRVFGKKNDACSIVSAEDRERIIA